MVILPFCALFYLFCIWKSTGTSEHCCVSAGVTNSGLALGFVCKTLLFCVVKLFHSWDASRNLTVLFHRYTHENPSPKTQTRTNFRSCPTKGSSVTWHSWLEPFIHFWCSLSLTTASSLLWSQRMFAWCFIPEMPRSPHHAPCATSLAVATPNPQTRKCSYHLGIDFFCQFLCFLFEDVV